MNILGIETSCDETAAAIVSGDRAPKLISSIVASQIALHRPFGGVVPELASRSHIRFITEVTERAVAKARMPLKRIGAIAATAGPGLPGSLLVGLTAAKTLAWMLRKPFLAVNHIEGHLYASFLTEPDLKPPLLALVASGGHTELIFMKRHGSFRILGRTRDDAAGEAYDKAAKLLKLGYPGGPALEKLAHGVRSKIKLPVARMKDGSLDFSFSGLKTAVAIASSRIRTGKDRATLAASFQTAVIEALLLRAREALTATRARTLVLAGGVSSNSALRESFERLAEETHVRLAVPPPKLCTDNAAMIACAGWFMARRGVRSSLEVPSHSGWQAGSPPPECDILVANKATGRP